MFKKKQEKSGVDMSDVINHKKSLLPEHRERPWVVQWVYFTVFFLFLLMIYTIVDYYS